MKTPVRVSITGGSVWGNRGAEAMLMTAIGEIRKTRPDAEFNVYTIYPDRDRSLVNDAKICFLSGKPLNLALVQFPCAILSRLFSLIRIQLPMPATISALRKSDVLLDIGGITFADGRAVFLLYNIFSIWPAQILGTPVVKLSQAMGPFKSSLNRLLARLFLPRCRRVFSRGNFTTQHLEKLPLPTTKWQQAADVAFLYQPDYSLSSENEEEVTKLLGRMSAYRAGNQRIIAISPSSLVLNKSEGKNVDYIAKIFDLIKHRADGNTRFVFLPNGSRASSTSTKNNDIIAIREFQRRAASELTEAVRASIDWVDFDINTRSIRKIIAGADVLLTSRFHAMVAGLSLCVPTLVIGWSHKYQETLADFGMDRYAVDFEDESMDLSKVLEELLTKNSEIRRQLEEALPLVRAASQKQFDFLESLFS